MEKKQLVNYLERAFCVLVPVYYDHETRPAWRKYHVTEDATEAREAYETAPDYLHATEDENRENRRYKRAEMFLLYDHGKRKEADAIRAQYQF